PSHFRVLPSQAAKGTLREEARPLVFTRGRANISKLRRKLIEGGPEIWSEEEHNRSNVHMKRPAHDQWGISKIVFVFCDDFMKKVFTFPWFNDPTWR
ncbi:unnamed protein product, partial [Discosporangium mesarthrocarpum]